MTLRRDDYDPMVVYRKFDPEPRHAADWRYDRGGMTVCGEKFGWQNPPWMVTMSDAGVTCGPCIAGVEEIRRQPPEDELNEVEQDAARVLYEDLDIEVGHEGIGGFCDGQAEATILVLRRAGFRLVRA